MNTVHSTVLDSRVPVLLRIPEGRTPVSLWLLGHGGYGHKQDDTMVRITDHLLSAGNAVLVIDGPVHGARRLDGGLDPEKVRKDWRAYWHVDPGIDEMVGDWHRALAYAGGLLPDMKIYYYYGLSMGTVYGLPLLARTPELSGAVLGMWGSGNHTGVRMLGDAEKVSQDVVFYSLGGDRIFPREDQITLFDRISSPRKRLIVDPGDHIPPTLETTTELIAQLVRMGEG